MEGTSSELSKCSIGLNLNDSCHKKNFVRRDAGFFAVNQISDEDKKLLEWRSGLTLADDYSICFHHHKVYLDRYESLQTAGMHSVCVCQQHQNVKLLLTVSPDKCDYKDYLSKLVCNTENRNCMLQCCENCPDLFSANEVDMDDNVTYKQWMHTDRTALVTLTTSVHDYI
ncbi:uncharacterized protein LOC117100179 [Anneissia japonica]|uniref:uncharacterized protein LOC117100179 n=1 Tax=Anneissia japonica TaxID=1529436 RepID=UPI001425AF5A|nr:uncharacterized protein LOC117100179 [Anneissia japonica]